MRAFLAFGLLALVACGPAETFQPFIHVTVVDQKGSQAPSVDTFEVTLTSVLNGNPITDVLEYEVPPEENPLPTDFVVLFSEQVRGQNVEIVVRGLADGVSVFTATTSATADTAEVEAVARFCGDQTIDQDRNETCDEGAQNSDTLPDGCRTSCQQAFCGDLVIDSGEQCEDGNTANEDGCSAQCQNEFCGDGILQSGLGEECDDGNNNNNDGCDDDCVGTAVTQIEAGQNHTCILFRTGSVRCWGLGVAGRLGYGNEDNIGDDELPSTAGDIDVGGKVTQIAAGAEHTCALLDTGKVRCWGNPFFGQLGYGNTNIIGDDEVPSAAGDVDVGGTVIQIDAGNFHTCALLDTGVIRCWGQATFGRLGYGNGLTIGDNETPASVGDVSIGGSAIQVATGGTHTCALLSINRVLCWGAGASGRLGYGNTNNIGDNELPSSQTSLGFGGEAVLQVAAGGVHTCVLLGTGDLRCWGLGSSGQLGYGNTNNIGDTGPISTIDVPVGGNSTQITTGVSHTCALLNTEAVKCWGSASNGQLGYGNTNNIGDTETPASIGVVDIGGNIAQIVTGDQHTCALLTNGSVRCWGLGDSGQLGYGNLFNIGDNEAISVAGDIAVF